MSGKHKQPHPGKGLPARGVPASPPPSTSNTIKSPPSAGARLATYENAMRNLAREMPSASSKQVLAVLVARDQVNQLRDEGAQLEAADVERLAKLDGELSDAAVDIDSIHRQELAAWKRSMDPESERWWWSLHDLAASERVKLRPRTALFATILLGLSFAITGDTVGQLLKLAAISAGVVAIIVQASLTFLTGSVLTESGRKWALNTLGGLGVAKTFRDTKVTVMAVAILAMSLLAWWLLPDTIARYYISRGDSYSTQKEWSQAIDRYKRALTLRPVDLSLHYKLAIAYDSSFQFDQAMDEYRAIVAVDSANASALNNLARLYIIEKTEDPALRLLDRVSEHLATLPVEQRYYVFKNRGWVKFGLQLYNDAEDDLRAALRARDGPAAHYLLGQVLEELKRPEEANPHYEKMLEIVAHQPETEAELEPDWIIRAQRKLQGGGK